MHVHSRAIHPTGLLKSLEIVKYVLLHFLHNESDTHFMCFIFG